MADSKLIIHGLPHMRGQGSAATFTNRTLSASTHKLCWIFQAPYADAITKIGFRYGTRTGTPPVYRASIQGVSTSTGYEDGTVKGGGSPASTTFTPPADTSWNSTWQWITLDNSYTPARGDLLAAVIEYSSGTIDASNCSSFTSDEQNIVNAINRFPYAGQSNLPTKFTYAIVWGITTTSYVYGNVFYQLYTTAQTTNGNRCACKFLLPGSSGTYKVLGFRSHGQFAGTAGKVPKIGLWDTAGTMIQEWTGDSDVYAALSAGYQDFYFDEASLTALNFGTSYYIGFQVNDAASGNLFLTGYQCNSGDIGAWPGGADWCMSIWNGSAWSDDTTVRPILGLILDDVTISAGGGGSAGIFFAVRP